MSVCQCNLIPVSRLKMDPCISLLGDFRWLGGDVGSCGPLSIALLSCAIMFHYGNILAG